MTGQMFKLKVKLVWDFKKRFRGDNRALGSFPLSVMTE